MPNGSDDSNARWPIIFAAVVGGAIGGAAGGYAGAQAGSETDPPPAQQQPQNP
jgi:hypothetical protein